MNPSPAEVVDLFTFAKVTLILYSTIAGHLAGLAFANSARPRRKQVSKVEASAPEPPKEETNVHAVTPPKPKGKEQSCGLMPAPPKERSKAHDDKPAPQHTKGKGKGKKGETEKKNQQRIPFFRGKCKKVIMATMNMTCSERWKRR